MSNFSSIRADDLYWSDDDVDHEHEKKSEISDHHDLADDKDEDYYDQPDQPAMTATGQQVMGTTATTTTFDADNIDDDDGDLLDEDPEEALELGADLDPHEVRFLPSLLAEYDYVFGAGGSTHVYTSADDNDNNNAASAASASASSEKEEEDKKEEQEQEEGEGEAVKNPASNSAEFYMEVDPMAEVDLSSIIESCGFYAKNETYREGCPDYNALGDDDDDSDTTVSTMALNEDLLDDEDMQELEKQLAEEHAAAHNNNDSSGSKNKKQTPAEIAAEANKEMAAGSAGSAITTNKNATATSNNNFTNVDLRRSVVLAHIQNEHDLAKPQLVDSPLEWPRVVRGGEDNDSYRLKHSPATRYMLSRMAVIFSISPEINKKKLEEDLNEHPVLGKMMKLPIAPYISVGYNVKEPIGVAAALPHDGDQRKILLETLPNARISKISWEDFAFFFKVSRIKIKPPLMSNKSNNNQQLNPGDPIPRAMRMRQWNDANLLASYLEQCGGPFKTKFICIDMEASCTRGNLHPLPLEYAMYGGSNEHLLNSSNSASSNSNSSCFLKHNSSTEVERLGGTASTNTTSTTSSSSSGGEKQQQKEDLERIEYHSFVHSGKPPFQTAALMLSLGHINGSHGIPYRNCTFLRTDYKNIVEELKPYFVDRSQELIFIFKGHSNADIDAFRWVFAAANDEVGDIPIIHGFSISALARALDLDQELVRPALRSYGGLDVEFNKMNAEKKKKLREEAQQEEKKENNNEDKKEDKKEKQEEEEEEDYPTLEVGRRCPPLPDKYLPTYCQSCWYHQRPATLERNPDMHCALFDSYLLFHRVQQMLLLHQYQKEQKEAAIASFKGQSASTSASAASS